MRRATGGCSPSTCRKAGTRLRAASASLPKAGGNHPEGERKTVTALFADIKGSTELMEDLDPEEARAIVDPALKLMIDAVHRYDGYVVQSTGDGIFALFGRRSHMRTIRSGRCTRPCGCRRNSSLCRASCGPGQPPVEVRIGINTGEVVMRSVHTGGHTRVLAGRSHGQSRFADADVAPTGAIVVSERRGGWSRDISS